MQRAQVVNHKLSMWASYISNDERMLDNALNFLNLTFL